jgi:hypothetical protein
MRQITLSYSYETYKNNRHDITATYKVSEKTFRRADDWLTQTANPTAEDLANWISNHGGTLHCTDGPAFIHRFRAPWPTTLESYYIDGNFVKEEWYHYDLSSIPGVKIGRTQPPVPAP